VEQAERAAKIATRDMFVAVACGRLRSNTFAADTHIHRRSVEQADIDKLVAAGRAYAARDGRTLLHMNLIGYRLDGSTSVPEARGMAGRTLAADLHTVTADDGPLSNLLQAVERADRPAAGVAPTPYASGLASTTQEERRLGVMCIDLGAGTTALSMFADGKLLAVDTVAVGGQHVTFDIARTLSTPFDEAERIKTLYGTLDGAASQDQGMVAYTLAGEEEPTLYQTTKAHIRGIISTRVADVLGQIAERLARSDVAHAAAQRVVLTGGASQLPGLSEFARPILGRPVRIAHLLPEPGLPPDCCKPAFSAAVGLIQIALDPTAGVRWARGWGALQGPGTRQRIGQRLLNGA
jgi:cell division protein FtsA